MGAYVFNLVGIKGMTFGVRLHVWGERACFTRPEMKAERISYDVMTPSAARGILDSIYWKPGMRWIIDRIYVLKPIRFQSFRRNEVGSKISVRLAEHAMRTGTIAEINLVVEDNRQQRAATLLVNVAYVVEAHFEIITNGRPMDQPAKHLSMFNRRAAGGQCFHRPYLGTREFPAYFSLVAQGAPLPLSSLPDDQRNRDLGWMLHDIDFDSDMLSRFFRARLIDGVLDTRLNLSKAVPA